MKHRRRIVSSAPAIEVERLSFEYGLRRALSNVSFVVREGEIFGLLGPNGSGKTTLFRILSTLLTPSGGNVKVFGKNIATDAHDIRKMIGVVFQSFALDKKLTVLENLRYHGFLLGMSGLPLAQQIESILSEMNVWERKDELVEKLSGGLQRRVEIAKGMLHRPRVLVLDEPSTGLDPGARRELWRLLRELRSRFGTTILLTTHLLDEAEQCDRIAILDQGTLVVLGTPAELKAGIGGEVISIATKNPATLARAIQTRLHVKAMIVDGLIHIEKDDGHRFIPKLIEAFPKDVVSVTVGKPSLEDVFVKFTGRAFREEREGSVE